MLQTELSPNPLPVPSQPSANGKFNLPPASSSFLIWSCANTKPGASLALAFFKINPRTRNWKHGGGTENTTFQRCNEFAPWKWIPSSCILEDKSWIFRGVEAENRIDLIVFSIRKGRFRRDFQGMLKMCVRLRKGLIAWKRYRSVEIDSTRDISALVGSLSRG